MSAFFCLDYQYFDHSVFSVDFNADFTPDFPTPSKQKESGATKPDDTPRQWTLFSTSPGGPLKIRDEESGEIFTIINEVPEPPPAEDLGSRAEEAKMYAGEEEEEEEDVGWCSLYLISKLLGLGLLIAGLAGMVIIAL